MTSQIIGGAPILTYRTRITTSGSFTVPAGVTLLNVRCMGGGGGAGMAGSTVTTAATDGTATTFSTLTAAAGTAGASSSSLGTIVAVSEGVSAIAGTGRGGQAGRYLGSAGYLEAAPGKDGSLAVGYLAVTPGQTITATIGAGGAGAAVNSGGYHGGAGGSGYIELEWQA